MDANWIRIDRSLPHRPETMYIADETDEPIEVVIGRLILMCLWTSRNSVDGFIPRATHRTLCRIAGGDIEFWDAVEEAGYIRFTDDGLLVGDSDGSRVDQD